MENQIAHNDAVLYVEDDAASRMLMAAIFRRHLPDVGLTLACTGDEGLRQLSGWTPSLVLLDGQLGDMSADDFIVHLRTQGANPCPPIVMISGAPSGETASGTIIGFLSKPFDLAQLVDTVSEHCQRAAVS